HGCHQPRLCRVGDIDNRGAEVLLVRDMPDISVRTGDGDLARAGQVEMAQAPHIAREHAVRIGHGFSLRMILSENRFPLFGIMRDYLSTVAPEAFTIAVHFGISAAI